MMRRTSNLMGVLGFVLAIAWSMPASAAQETASFPVTAVIQSSVTVRASGIDFGSFPKLAEVTTSGSVTVNAPTGTNYTIALGTGLYPGSGGMVTRNMASSSTPVVLLRYEMYTDAGMNTIWGNGITVPGTGNGSDRIHTIAAKVFGSQNVGPGSYSDQIQVTVTF